MVIAIFGYNQLLDLHCFIVTRIMHEHNYYTPL